MTSLNIVFAGTPEFGLPCLEALHHSLHSLRAIYTQPDRPAGRGQRLQPSAVKKWAENYAIPVLQPDHFKEEKTVDELAALAPDVLIVIAYGLILPKKVLKIPRWGCINVHASLLPRWRGASPIQSALLHGDEETGVAVMQMAPGMDTGDVLSERRCPITTQDTAGTLHDKLALLAVDPLLETLDQLANASLHRQPQDVNQVTYAAKIKKEDARIDWNRSAKEIDQQIRAFNPWPIAYTLAKDQLVRIHEAHELPGQEEAKAGMILSMDKTGLKIATSKGVVCVQRLQLPGGKVITVTDYLNSGRNQLAPGLILQ